MAKINRDKFTKEEVEFLKESNAIEEVYDDRFLETALKAWDSIRLRKELTMFEVLNVHKILMSNHFFFPPEYRGKFRNVPVYIGGREGIKHEFIEPAIENWLERINKPRTADEVLEDHLIYEEVHGFIDGNGRTGRIFMLWEWKQNGLPVQIIHADWPDPLGEQIAYYDRFKK